MKRSYIVLTTLFFASSALAAVTDWNWWGQVSFRQRHEVKREYVDSPSDPRWGTIKSKEDNSSTLLGYQFGFKTNLRDNLFAGVTLRSGLRSDGTGSVMWQEINNRTGLLPALQEAYLDWNTPYVELIAGKIPQKGNPMWDLYSASLYIDFRQDDPTDGIFNDRMAALSGARALVPVGPVTLRGTYHTDFVGGTRKHWYNSSQEDQYQPQMDQKTFLLGGEIKLSELARSRIPSALKEVEITLDGDYGFVYRVRNMLRSDSVYADEDLWGANLKASRRWLEFQAGYGHNFRDSVFKADYWDLLLSAEQYGFKLTGRYQDNRQEFLVGIYEGHEAMRRAYHIYLNKTLWGLDLQPRYIFSFSKVDDRKWKSSSRYELTATARF